jgi:Rha family phage regulatory protein
MNRTNSSANGTFNQEGAIALYRELVMLDGDAGYTTSSKIAARFNRPHYSVLKSIDRINGLIKSQKIQVMGEMFKDHSYIDARGKLRRGFLVNKDGFALLAMRFDGAEAFEWQLNFIAAFNWLVDQVRERNENQRLMDSFDIKNRKSVDLGSSHGKGLKARQTEIPLLESERIQIETKIQGALPLDSTTQH